MENSEKRSAITAEILVLTACCLLIGCARTPHRQRNTGLPVRVGTQDTNGLPVELQMDETKPLPVRAKVVMDENGPFEVVLDQNKPLSVNANVQADCEIQVKITPASSIWLAVAALGLIVFVTMITAIVACSAAISAKRAAEK